MGLWQSRMEAQAMPNNCLFGFTDIGQRNR
jgi:hypothetical protein